jgi:hypothetical protein
MSVKTNTVNCWNAKSKDMPISSQASEESVEGSETRSWSPDRTVKAHECSTPNRGEDIVPASVEMRSGRIKSLPIRSCYQSQYGRLDVVIDRSKIQTSSAILLMDFEYSATPVLRATQDIPLATTGDAENRQVIRESTYALLNTKACAAVDAIPATLTTGA